jgi:hypothetical protein
MAFFLIVLVFGIVMKIRSLSKNLKNIDSNSFIFDIMISLSSFLLLVNTNTIIDIFDNSSGCFMVYIEDIMDSTDYLAFYNSDYKEINNVKMNKRGRLDIESDENYIIVRYNGYKTCFNYLGNEVGENISLDPSVTKIYTPYSDFTEIKKKENFWGYEYIEVKKNAVEHKIYLDNSLYFRKLFMAVSITAVIFSLSRSMLFILKKTGL